jgi:predicted transcriptional regulator
MTEPMIASYSTGNRAVLSTWVPEDLASAIQRIARDDDRSVSAVLRRAVSSYVKAHDHQQTKESVAA